MIEKKLMSGDFRNLLILIIIWLAVIIIIKPYGEFPYADDFAYAGPVKHLLDTGQLKITDWSSMTLIGHIYIGYLASLIFGYSFLTLRITVLAFALASAIGSFKLSKRLLGSKSKALIVSLLFMLTPQFVLNSFSYMTDITFICFFVWSAYFYVRYLDTSKYAELWIAIAFNIYAYLIRDIAIIMPFAFALAYFQKHRFNMKSIMNSLVPVIIILVVFFGYRYWFEHVHGLTKNIDFSRNRSMLIFSEPFVFFKGIVRNFLLSLLYLGFYLSPLLLPESISRIKKSTHKKIYLISALILFAGSVASYFVFHTIPHLAEFMLGDHLSINSLLVPDVHNPSTLYTDVLPGWIVFPCYFAGILGASALLLILFDRLRKMIDNFRLGTISGSSLDFILLISMFYYLLLLTQIPFNRYYIFMFLVLGLIISIKIPEFHQHGRFTRYATIAVFAIIAMSSIAAAHNMMQYNRARWQAAEYLIEDLNVPVEKIDGGFEFNSYYFYNYDYKKEEKKNWWFVQDDEYVISWGEMKSYSTILEIKYFRFYPPGFNAKVYIGKRK